MFAFPKLNKCLIMLKRRPLPWPVSLQSWETTGHSFQPKPQQLRNKYHWKIHTSLYRCIKMSSEAVSLFLSKCHFLSFAYQYAHSTMTASYTCSGKKKNAISYLGSQLSFFDKRSTRVFKFDTARGFMAKSNFFPSVARTRHLLWRALLKRTAVPHRYA